MRLKEHWATEQLEFDGHDFSPGWVQRRFGLKGESIIAFVGPFCPDPAAVCFPQGSERLRGKRMLHLVVEHQHGDVEKARLEQQLLLNILKDKLNHRLKGDIIQRWRQDLCQDAAHITASTIQMTSSLAIIYVGVNIERSQPQSMLWGLADGGVDAHELAQVVMDQYVFETEGLRRPVD